jgi:hypothetical protein
MKVTVKEVLIPISILAGFLIIIFILLSLLWNTWWYSYMPSSGIWQYSDDDLTITVYVPREDEISPYMSKHSPPSWYDTLTKYKAEISYNNGKKQKAIIAYHSKMYNCYIALVNDYSNIINGNGEFYYTYESSYIVPMKKGEWEFKDAYKGKILVFKKIGKYKEPEF